jgi:hypothetical protein
VQLDAAHATAQAVVKAGQLAVTGDRDLACEMDLLGHVYQELRNPKARKPMGRSAARRQRVELTRTLLYLAHLGDRARVQVMDTYFSFKGLGGHRQPGCSCRHPSPHGA